MALPVSFSLAFEEYLNSLPWSGSSLDWSRMDGCMVFNAAVSDGVALRAWIDRTGIGRHPLVAVWYSIEEGGLVVPRDLAIDSLDELYRYTPGVRYSFGAFRLGDRLHCAFADLLEYGRGDELIATPR